MPSTRRTITSTAPATSSLSSNRACMAGPISEKPGRIRRPCLTGVAARLHRQRGHWPHQLPLDVKWATARGQNRHRWALARQHLGHAPGRIQDMLATVQHQQRVCLAQVLSRRLQGRAAGSAAHRFQHSAVDQAGVGQRSKLNQVDVPPTQVTGAEAQLQGQAGLTDTADANQGDKSLSRPEQRPELAQLSFPANEGRQGHRKVAGDLHILRVVSAGARSEIMCLPHANIMTPQGRGWPKRIGVGAHCQPSVGRQVRSSIGRSSRTPGPEWFRARAFSAGVSCPRLTLLAAGAATHPPGARPCAFPVMTPRRLGATRCSPGGWTGRSCPACWLRVTRSAWTCSRSAGSHRTANHRNQVTAAHRDCE